MQLPASPLARKSAVSLVRSVSVAQLVEEWNAQFNINVRSEFQDATVIREWRCNHSGLTFFTPTTCVGSAKLYRQLGQFAWYYMDDKWEYREALKLLGTAKRLLEIGCGDGHFLSKAHRLGLKVHGLELAPPEKSVGEGSAWKISEESVRDHARNHPSRYDMVCAFQVLEHVSDPASFLESCVELISTGGKLILSTPNSRSFLRHSFNLLDMPPHHMSGWSVQSYRFLENTLPLKLEKIMYEPLARYHVNYFMETYSSRFPERHDLRGAWARGAIGELSRKLLNSGMRSMIRGQSMLAVFSKCS